MGVTGSLRTYPAEALEKAHEDNTYYPHNAFTSRSQQYHLYRAWDELHPAFEKLGEPLALALTGDYAPAGGLRSFGWNEDNKEDHYCGWISPHLVASIARHLAVVTFDQIFPDGAPLGDQQPLREAFEQVRRCYADASARSECVFVQFA